MTKKIIYLLAVVLVAIVAYFAVDFVRYNQSRHELIDQRGSETTAELRDVVDDILQRITLEADSLAAALGSHNYEAAEIEALIQESSRRIPEIQGVTACYEPFAFSESQQLYCPYYNKGTSSYTYVG